MTGDREPEAEDRHARQTMTSRRIFRKGRTAEHHRYIGKK